MTDRITAREAFLAGTPWAAWQIEPVAGDASSRSYFRLTQGAESLILMDAGPAQDTGTTKFLIIAKWLTRHGFAAPEICKSDLTNGFLLLDDLGRDSFAVAARTTSEDVLYDVAVDVLIALDRLQPADGLDRMTPEVGGQMVAITAEFYGQCDPAPLVTAVTDALQTHAPDAGKMALRDYHAENLIWRPDRQGLDRAGLLDFQDAFVAPRGYDLVSLLRDIRRQVSPEQVVRQTRRFAEATGEPADRFARQLATLGAQRNLRILGVFARLSQNGKPQYARFLPQVWDLLMLDLADPALTDLRQSVLTHLSPPQDQK